MRVEAKYLWFKFSNASVYHAFCLTDICSSVNVRSIISIINVCNESYFVARDIQVEKKNRWILSPVKT